MKKLDCTIQIDKYRFDSVTEIEINSDWEHLTDTCSITLPRNAKYLDDPTRFLAFGDDPLFRRGMAVKVLLGYDKSESKPLVKQFEGYIVAIGADVPTVFDCQDAMYQLKKKSVNISYPRVMLSKLLKDMIGDTVQYICTLDFQLGLFGARNETPAQVLARLKKDYFVRSFVRNGTLYVGLAIVPSLQNKQEIRLRFGEEVIVQDTQLEYLVKDDVKINLVAKLITPNNKLKEFKFGDPDGEQRTVHFYDVPERDVETLAKKEIERYRYTGYRGNLTIFGEPSINHGDIVTIEDPVYSERTGNYVVKKVTKTFGMGGYRQILELETRIFV